MIASLFMGAKLGRNKDAGLKDEREVVVGRWILSKF